MSDRIMRTCYHDVPKSRDSKHPCQSVWMAHWMQASYKSTPQVHNHHFLHDESRDDHCTDKDAMLVPINKSRVVTRLDVNKSPDNSSECSNARIGEQRLEIASDISQPAEGKGAVNKARRFEFMNQILAVNSKHARQHTPTVPPFQMINVDRIKDGALASKEGLSINGNHEFKLHKDENSGRITTAVGTNMPDFAPGLLPLSTCEIEYPSRECCFPPEGTSLALDKWMKSHISLEKSSLPVSRFFKDNLSASTSLVPLIMPRHDKFYQVSPGIASKEHITNSSFARFGHCHVNTCNCSTLFAYEKNIDSHLSARKCGALYFGQTDGDLLHDPSTSNYNFPTLVGEQNVKLQRFSGLQFFPGQSSHTKDFNQDGLKRGCHSLTKIPACSVHDMETMRFSSAVDFVEGETGAHLEPPQKTQHKLMTKKTDINFFNGGHVIEESTLHTNLKENSFSRLPSLLSKISFNGDLGAKLQHPGKSMNDIGKEARGFKTCSLHLMSESSAETDTLDIGIIHEKKNLRGIASSLPNKDLIGAQNREKFQATLTSSIEKVANRWAVADTNKNQDLPSFSDATGLIDKRELSTSKTESLDVEHVILHAEPPVNSNTSTLQREEFLDPEPSSRWVKRLKCSSHSFGHGTKSLKMGEASARKKVNGFAKIMSYKTSSEPTSGNRLRLGQMDRTLTFLSNRQSFSTDHVKEGQEITLSHSWIQRLCHNRSESLQMKPEDEVVCEPRKSKVKLDELRRKKKFPSIAAMALMGKVMSSFCPCERRKTGSYVVWN